MGAPIFVFARKVRSVCKSTWSDCMARDRVSPEIAGAILATAGSLINRAKKKGFNLPISQCVED
jgi:hypothetical protein